MAPQTLKQIREKQRENARRYHQKMKDDPEYKRKQKEKWQKWYQEKKRKEKEQTD